MEISRQRVLTTLLVLTSLLAGSCGGADNACEYPDAQLNEGGVRVGLALDVGGIGDKSFNDAAKRGLDAAVADGLASEVNCLEANSTGSNRGENVLALADAGYDIVIANGFLFSTDIREIAPDYPDVNFAVTDGFANALWDDPETEEFETPPANITNVADLTFKEHEGSFLVGAAAALVCECDTVGFLGGQTDAPLIQKFEAGFAAGAKYINPDMEVLVEYIDPDPAIGFNDAVKGAALSNSMYDDGAELIYHAAGASGAGLFNAAVEQGKLAIGVDSDQYLTASAEQQPLIVTSMLKRVDTATYDAIQQTVDGDFQSGFQVFGIAEDGIGYSTSNAELMTEDIIAQVDEIKQMILDGAIEVPEIPEGVEPAA